MPVRNSEMEAYGDSGLIRKAALRYSHNRLAMVALGVLIVMVLTSLIGPWLNRRLGGYDPTRLVLEDRFQLPSRVHWVGTDDVGHDLFSRLLSGARVSLGLAFLAALMAVIVGGLLGVVAGFAGGWVDDVISALVNTVLAIPALFLLIVLAAYFRPTTLMLAVLVASLSWMEVARLMRGSVLVIKEHDYILAARSVGVPTLRLILRHILPNALPTIVVATYLAMAVALLRESALSYLGLGVQPPEPSWGNMLSKSMSYVFRAPYLLFPPGLAIFATVLCIYLVGDALRDATDPRML